MRNLQKNKPWYVYILKCADGTFYTGITNDLKSRIEAHESGKGAKYTRGRGPFELHYKEPHETRSDATKREMEIKRLSRQGKMSLEN
jgi:putative endonuclease